MTGCGPVPAISGWGLRLGLPLTALVLLRAIVLLRLLLLRRLLIAAIVLAGIIVRAVEVFAVPLVVILAVVTVIAIVTLEAFLHLRLGGRDDPVVVFGMLQIVFCHDAVAGALGVAGECGVFFSNMLGGAADLHVRAGAVIGPG